MARRLDTKGQYNSAEASEQDIISVLTTVDATNYPATIAGQIDRIGDAHEIIQRKALKMKLKVPAGQGDRKSETTTLLTQDHLLMDTAAAINTISINNGGTITLDAGKSYTVPVGYNVGEYKISAKTVADNLTVTTLTSSDDLISGLTAYTIQGGKATKITGKLANYRGSDQAATSYKNSSSKLAIKIPATGAYSSSNYLTTTIPYLTSAGNLTINVKRTGSANTALIEDFVVPAGYYPTDTSVKVTVMDDKVNIGEINVQATKAATGAGTVTPSDGFDYLKQVTVGAASGFSILDNGSRELSVGSYNTTNNGYAVTAANVVGKFSTAGWITTANNTDSSVVVGKLPKATFGFTNNIVKSTGAGYIPSGETLLTMSPYTHGMSIAQTTTAITNPGDNTVDVAANHYYVKFNVKTPGYATVGDHYQDIGSKVSCSDFNTSATTDRVTYVDKAVNAKTTYLDITGNYQPGAQYIKATVKSASAPILSITDKTDTVTVGAKNSSGKFPISVSNLTGTISVNTPGWFTGGTATDSSVTVGTLPASVHTCGAIQLGKDIGAGLTTDHCYVTCTTSTGYTLGETKYIDLGIKGSGFTLDTASPSQDIVKGTYYMSLTTISVANVNGLLRDLSGEKHSNIAHIDPNKTLPALENFTSDTTIVGKDNQFLSSVTIEVSGIIDKLSQI